jgi:hypothetical protein
MLIYTKGFKTWSCVLSTELLILSSRCAQKKKGYFLQWQIIPAPAGAKYCYGGCCQRNRVAITAAHWDSWWYVFPLVALGFVAMIWLYTCQTVSRMMLILCWLLQFSSPYLGVFSRICSTMLIKSHRWVTPDCMIILNNLYFLRDSRATMVCYWCVQHS